MTSPADAIGMFFTREVQVERFAGAGPRGDTWEPAETIGGRVKNERRLIRNAAGEEVVSSSACSFPVDTSTIPVGSRVTPPGDDAPRLVLAEARHIGIPGVTPDYYSIDLE